MEDMSPRGICTEVFKKYFLLIICLISFVMATGNGSTLGKIDHCGVPRCKLCKDDQLDTISTFYSNFNKTPYYINFHQNCRTTHCVYLISCSHPNCTMQYVGKTTLSIQRRLALH